MQVFYAPFRALEKQFADYTAALQPGPKRQVLVLCPSARVAARLRRLCAQKTGFISHVFFCTFSQLLTQLDAENSAAKEPLLPADSLHDYLLKVLMSEPGLEYYKPSRGFLRALRASLRDLADALAEPDMLEEQLRLTSDPLLQSQLPHLQWLIKVYRAYLQKMNELPGYRSYQQYFSDALTALLHSAYLHSFHEIIIYGFYELTGRQLDIFSALISGYPAAVFWLYAKHPAFAFGHKFFETNVQGCGSTQELPICWEGLAAGEALRHLFTSQQAACLPQGLHWIAASETEGEVYQVVKEIVRLHEEQGIAYEDMAVCARSLENYKAVLPAVCAQNAVPLNASFSFGFLASQLGVFLNNLLSLARGGFEREDVLAVVSSAYFKKKNQWRYLIDECLAERDFNQWQNLVTQSLAYYDADFLAWLAEIKRQLEFLEKPLPWSVLCQGVQQLLEENVEPEQFTAEEKAVWQEMQKVLGSFERYAYVSDKAKEGEFLDELFSALQETSWHESVPVGQGVNVLDALSMRGLSFQVVFVLGMNEKNFPPIQRQDPFLRDYYRRLLRDRLGFRLNQKAERFEEERLLFFCILEAASEQIYLSFLRSDAEGKPLVPSGYLVELARAAGTDFQQIPLVEVNGHLVERLKQTPPCWLNEKEMSCLLAVEGADMRQYEQAHLAADGLKEVLHASRRIVSWGALTEYDGVVSCGEEIFHKQNEMGFAPSVLQDLARCPMKYFLAKGIGLREKEEALSREELAPSLRGRAYHQVLMDYYAALYREGLAGELFPNALQQRLDRALEKNYQAQSYRQFGIYPVIWELILKDMRSKLECFVVQDAQHLDGFVPSIFETLFEKYYSLSAEIKIKLKGIVDRIDVNSKDKSFRVLDYKSGRHGSKNLAADMFKKVILQPFIYLLLTQQQPQTQGLRADGAALLTIQKGYGRQELSAAGFDVVRPRAEQFVEWLVRLMQQGVFFINPGEHCQYCPYAAVCRKDAYHSLLRAKHAPQARTLEEAKR